MSNRGELAKQVVKGGRFDQYSGPGLKLPPGLTEYKEFPIPYYPEGWKEGDDCAYAYLMLPKGYALTTKDARRLSEFINLLCVDWNEEGE